MNHLSSITGTPPAETGRDNGIPAEEKALYRHVHAKMVLELEDLLSRMLHLDKYRRITPQEAMEHDFFRSAERLSG